MGLSDHQGAYEQYCHSLDSLVDVQQGLARDISIANQEYEAEVSRIESDRPDWNVVVTEAEERAEHALADGTELLSSIGVQGMLPKKRRPTNREDLATLDVESAQDAMYDCLSKLDKFVAAIRANRERPPESPPESSDDRSARRQKLTIPLIVAAAIVAAVVLVVVLASV